MDSISRQQMLDEISKFTLPSYNEIPNVGLFLEQVTKYITEYTGSLESVSITGSMISNYVKKKIVRNPIKKQYDREQIAILIFIAITKTVLSLEDIQQLLDLAPWDRGTDHLYEIFRSQLLTTLQQVFEGEEVSQDTANLSLDASIEAALLKHTVDTVAHKIYLDKYFAQSRKLEV